MTFSGHHQLKTIIYFGIFTYLPIKNLNQVGRINNSAYLNNQRRQSSRPSYDASFEGHDGI
jgi:hypothetical protein